MYNFKFLQNLCKILFCYKTTFTMFTFLQLCKILFLIRIQLSTIVCNTQIASLAYTIRSPNLKPFRNMLQWNLLKGCFKLDLKDFFLKSM